jgi:DNA-binding MarR family transcriptional regulator
VTGEERGGNEATSDQAMSADELSQKLIAGLAKIGLASRHRAWSEAEGQGLTPTQGQILTMLRRHPAGGMRLTDLAEDLAVAAATATVAVQALERKGLIQKTRSRDDGRVRTITLTATGRVEAERAAGWSDFLLAATDELAPEEQEVFYRGLMKMIRTMQLRGEIPISGMCVTCRFFRPNVHPDDSSNPHHCAYVNAPFGDRHLRLECPEHELAAKNQVELQWRVYVGGADTERSAASGE